MRPLYGHRAQLGSVEADLVAPVGHDLAGEEPHEDLELVLQPVEALTYRREVQTEPVVLRLVPRGADAELETSLAVHGREVVEAPGAVEPEVLAESHPVDDFGEVQPLLCHVDSQPHAPIMSSGAACVRPAPAARVRPPGLRVVRPRSSRIRIEE